MRFTTPTLDLFHEELVAFETVFGRKPVQVDVSVRVMDGIRKELTRLYDAPYADKASVGDVIMLMDVPVTVTTQSGLVLVAK